LLRDLKVERRTDGESARGLLIKIGVAADHNKAQSLHRQPGIRGRIHHGYRQRLSSIAFGNQTIWFNPDPDSTVLRPCLATGLPLSEQSSLKELALRTKGESFCITQDWPLFVKI
jgi:hypothetical protein